MASAAGFPATARDDDAADDDIAPDGRAVVDDPAADAAAAIEVRNSLRFTIHGLLVLEFLGPILIKVLGGRQGFDRSKTVNVQNSGRLFACGGGGYVLMIMISRLVVLPSDLQR